MRNISKKVCLIGDYAVGKTSLVRRFVHGQFDDRYLSTIGVKVSRKSVVVAHSEEVIEITMMLWDLAASEELTALRASYLRGAAGVLLVADLTRPATWEHLPAYKADIDAVSPGAPCVLAANKADLLPGNDAGRVTLAAVQAVAHALAAPLCLTSALTGDQVEDAFRHLGHMMAGGAS